MPIIISGSDILATPPCERMSEGTRSSAMTATAPASSAIFACSALVTSMMTPPFCMRANPAFSGNVPFDDFFTIFRAFIRTKVYCIMPRMSQILVSGSLAYDRIMDFPGLFKDHFVADKLHNINVSFQVADLSEQFGGTAGNVAYSLALLGEQPHIIGTVGTDFVRYRTWMEKFGIATGSIRTFPDKPTSAPFIITDHADNQIAAFHLGAGGED